MAAAAKTSSRSAIGRKVASILSAGAKPAASPFRLLNQKPLSHGIYRFPVDEMSSPRTYRSSTLGGCFDSQASFNLTRSRENSPSLSRYLGNLNLGATRFYSSSVNPPTNNSDSSFTSPPPNNGDARPMRSSIYPPPNNGDARPMRSSIYPPPSSGDARPLRSSLYPPPNSGDPRPVRNSMYPPPNNDVDVEPLTSIADPPLPNNRDAQPRRVMDFVREIGEDGNLNSSRYEGVEQNSDIVHITLKRNNTFVTITDYKGDKKAGASSGCLKELKSGLKNSTFTAEATAEHIGKLARNLGVKSVVIKVNGFTHFNRKKKDIMSFREGYNSSGGNHNPIVHIEDHTRLAHNGCRLPKKRRI